MRPRNPFQALCALLSALTLLCIASGIGLAETFDVQQRRQTHWAWQPIVRPQSPSVPNPKWNQNPVDRFIFATLAGQGLHPSEPAAKSTLIRRLHFDLLGLPPSPEAVVAFGADSSPDAYERLVDRLLASPQFGERWARHWLDLVRYSETLGHEFDYAIPNAWRYRDYVIRALNSDIPYDQFLLEHVAGDLLQPPRRDSATGANESVIGTGFYWFGQQAHSPVDVRQNQAEVVENQIDVLTKTFLGMTVACARCHDHKFDAISTQDYYALYGTVTSSRYAQRSIRSPADLTRTADRLKTLRTEVRRQLGRVWTSRISDIGEYVVAAHAALAEASTGATETDDVTRRAASISNRTSRDRQLDPERLGHWIAALRALATLETASSPGAASTTTHVQTAENPSLNNLLNDFSSWFVDGDAFETGLVRPGDFIIGDSPAAPVRQIFLSNAAHSAALSKRFEGALRSPTFTVAHRYLHLLVAGRESRINVFVDNFALVQEPIYGGLRRVVNSDSPKWIAIDLEMWKGRRAYIELSDIPTPDLAGGGKREGYKPDGYIALAHVAVSDSKEPPQNSATSDSLAKQLLPTDRTLSAATFELRVQKAIQHWTGPVSTATPDELALLDWLVQHGLLELSGDAGSSNTQSSSELRKLERLLADYAAVESNISSPERVPAMADGTGLDEFVFVRGNPNSPGPIVRRRFLEAIAGDDPPPFQNGSGRLELGQMLIDERNPLVARVLVNRVWLHLFGRGIVATPDDFGVLGQTPSHPALLDWLASYFREEGQWSIKRLIRLLVTSTTYKMTSAPSAPAVEEKDPDNRLWHRMPVRRMESEIIRDTILAVSGQLDPTMFGPSVPVHLTEFMDGRGRPGRSGPLDGDRRRSIYIEVRRNFLSPMMRTFDAPVPFTTAGSRPPSNVPAQSLILMNDAFVIEQSHHWAKRLSHECGADPKERVRNLYLTAFSREPDDDELTAALVFIKQQRRAYAAHAGRSAADNEKRAWADLCHVIMNLKEFIFVP